MGAVRKRDDFSPRFFFALKRPDAPIDVAHIQIHRPQKFRRNLTYGTFSVEQRDGNRLLVLEFYRSKPLLDCSIADGLVHRPQYC